MIYTTAVSVSMLLYLPSCSKNASEEAKEEALQELEEMKAKQKTLEVKLAMEEAKKEAEKKEAEQKAATLKAELAAEKEIAEKKLIEELAKAAEAEKIKQEEIKRRQDIQSLALSKYVKTKYDELVLLDGKVLKSVEVRSANPSKVSLMHQSGVKSVKYSNLPPEIGEVCLYDEELEIIYLEEKAAAEVVKAERAKKKAMLLAEQKAAKAEAKAIAKAEAAKATRHYGGTKSSNSRPAEAAPVKPKGNLRVQVVASRKGSKTIELKAKSNVDAILVLNDWIYHRNRRRITVKADQTFSHTWSGVSNKYEVKLITKDSNIELAKEAWNRKSGLGR